MSGLVRVTAVQPHDGHQPGADYEVPERQANDLLKRRLVKMAPAVLNKMAQPAANKRNPISAAGKVPQSSASPAAPVLPQTIAKPSDVGGLAHVPEPPKRGPGRPKRPPAMDWPDPGDA
jgi:hypothetical protein